MQLRSPPDLSLRSHLLLEKQGAGQGLSPGSRRRVSWRTQRGALLPQPESPVAAWEGGVQFHAPRRAGPSTEAQTLSVAAGKLGGKE